MLESIPARPVNTQFSHLAAFGQNCELVNKTELAAAARAIIGEAVDVSFTRFIDWLRSERYTFAGFDKRSLRYGDRCAYLRYDVHPKDLLPAYVLANLHERFGIIGSFQITWKFWRGDEEYEPYFKKLLEYDQRFIEFGLHAAPVASWYIEEKFGGDPVAAAASIDSEEFTAWLLELHAAYTRDGDDAPLLRQLRAGADDALSTIAASYRETFGELKSVSGHGNFLATGYAQVHQRHRQIWEIGPYFMPGAYFEKFGVEHLGFNHLAAGLGEDPVPFPRMLWEGGTNEERRRLIQGRVANGLGFVILTHPASWTTRLNATFFMPEEPSS